MNKDHWYALTRDEYERLWPLTDQVERVAENMLATWTRLHLHGEDCFNLIKGQLRPLYFVVKIGLQGSKPMTQADLENLGLLNNNQEYLDGK